MLLEVAQVLHARPCPPKYDLVVIPVDGDAPVAADDGLEKLWRVMIKC